jgi:hypothetical protein
MGFGYVPPQTKASVAVSNLRLLQEVEARLVNPVLKVGKGKLRVQGSLPSDRYLWFTGGDTIGVYDLNWNLLDKLPVVKENFRVPAGPTRYRIDAEPAAHMPWLAVQILTKGVPLRVPLAR